MLNVNKSLMKFLTDFGPLLIFFIFYYKSGNDMSVAIPPLIVSTLIAVIIVFYIDKKIPYVPLIGAILISFFGGLSLYFDNPVFIYLKPTIINILFAITLIISNKFFNKNFIQIVLSKSFSLSDTGWNKLNTRWAIFFIFLAILNEIIWRTQSESIWVNFKVWGILPLTILFTALQVPLINKYKL
tara:strand:- start:993 stop:1547 length:555 start_codon:yes stop_codon:yes gene_type:complete